MRVPTYVIGVCLGCYLQNIDCKFELNKVNEFIALFLLNNEYFLQKLFWLGNSLASIAAFYCLAWHHDITEPDYVHSTEVKALKIFTQLLLIFTISENFSLCFSTSIYLGLCVKLVCFHLRNRSSR